MYRLKAKHRHMKCTYCKRDGLKVPGVYRTIYFSEVACEMHKARCEADDRRLRNDHETEGERRAFSRYGI